MNSRRAWVSNCSDIVGGKIWAKIEKVVKIRREMGGGFLAILDIDRGIFVISQDGDNNSGDGCHPLLSVVPIRVAQIGNSAAHYERTLGFETKFPRKFLKKIMGQKFSREKKQKRKRRGCLAIGISIYVQTHVLKLCKEMEKR